MTDPAGGDLPGAVGATIREHLTAAGIVFEEPGPGTFVLQLPGERKLRTTVSLVVGGHSLSINAFVCRKPDENHAEVFRWLLQRNRRLFAVAYSLDRLGDIYLTGRLPLAAVEADTLDLVLGGVLTAADGDFNKILELGFGSAIRAEWRWRLERGEPTGNLAEFRHLRPVDLPTPED